MSVLHTQAPQASLGWDESRAKHPFIHSEAHRSKHWDIFRERERERGSECAYTHFGSAMTHKTP